MEIRKDLRSADTPTFELVYTIPFPVIRNMPVVAWILEPSSGSRHASLKPAVTDVLVLLALVVACLLA